MISITRTNVKVFRSLVDTDAHCSEEQYIFCIFRVAEKGRLNEGEGEGVGGREAIDFLWYVRCSIVLWPQVLHSTAANKKGRSHIHNNVALTTVFLGQCVYRPCNL